MTTRHAYLLLAVLVGAGCSPHDDTQAKTDTTTPPATTTPTATPAATPPPAPGLTKLGIVDVKVGSGPGVQAGDLLNMTYVGSLKDGSVFDSTDKHEGAAPFGFILGTGSVIAGWDKGLVGMKKGGERKLSIPAAMGYGERDMPGIPANSDLYFDVKLLDFVKKGESNIYDRKDIVKGTGEEVTAHKTVVIHYVAKNAAGQVVSTAKDVKFKQGNQEILPAIDEGIIGARVGGTRRFRLPPGLARSGNATGQGLDPNTIFTFDITVDKVSP